MLFVLLYPKHEYGADVEYGFRGYISCSKNPTTYRCSAGSPLVNRIVTISTFGSVASDLQISTALQTDTRFFYEDSHVDVLYR